MNNDLIEVIDGKYWLCDDKQIKVRMLTDEECADYIWGKDDPLESLTPLEQCLVRILPGIKSTATSYDAVYHEHEMPPGCVSSDGIFIALAEIRSHLDKLGVIVKGID